mmetsp:Transcript_90796/g.256423  ORF Transcript_90796/g.256423 Transcript_90796/m.256423 type:complete len:241 (-) Transcript_90796:9-731(-)
MFSLGASRFDFATPSLVTISTPRTDWSVPYDFMTSRARLYVLISPSTSFSPFILIPMAFNTSKESSAAPSSCWRCHWSKTPTMASVSSNTRSASVSFREFCVVAIRLTTKMPAGVARDPARRWISKALYCEIKAQSGFPCDATNLPWSDKSVALSGVGGIALDHLEIPTVRAMDTRPAKKIPKRASRHRRRRNDRGCCRPLALPFPMASAQERTSAAWAAGPPTRRCAAGPCFGISPPRA